MLHNDNIYQRVILMHEYAVLVNVTTVVCHTFRDRVLATGKVHGWIAAQPQRRSK